MDCLQQYGDFFGRGLREDILTMWRSPEKEAKKNRCFYHAEKDNILEISKYMKIAVSINVSMAEWLEIMICKVPSDHNIMTMMLP